MVVSTAFENSGERNNVVKHLEQIFRFLTEIVILEVIIMYSNASRTRYLNFTLDRTENSWSWHTL